MQFATSTALTVLAGVFAAGSAIAAPAAVGSPSTESTQELEARRDGTITYYYQNGNPGACGDYSSDSDWVIATPNWDSSQCGKKIWISHNGKTRTGTVKDSCPPCDGGHLDLSQGLFNQFASDSQGQVDVTWGWA